MKKFLFFLMPFLVFCSVSQGHAAENEMNGGIYDAIVTAAGDESTGAGESQDGATDSMLVVDVDSDFLPTHPLLRLSPDKSEIVRLERDAASVIVGNPDNISVLIDNPRLLVVVPHASGASHFIVMDKNSHVIMQRHVVVAAAKEKYIKIRNTCEMGGNNCQGERVYYCPDACYSVAFHAKDKRGSSSSSSSRRGTETSSSYLDDALELEEESEHEGNNSRDYEGNDNYDDEPEL